jgi:hypothetical protein
MTLDPGEPVVRIAHGFVRASIWRHVADDGDHYKIMFERKFKDAAGNAVSSSVFQTLDLLALAKVAEQAYTKILELRGRAADSV